MDDSLCFRLRCCKLLLKGYNSLGSVLIERRWEGFLEIDYVIERKGR